MGADAGRKADAVRSTPTLPAKMGSIRDLRDAGRCQFVTIAASDGSGSQGRTGQLPSFRGFPPACPGSGTIGQRCQSRSRSTGSVVTPITYIMSDNAYRIALLPSMFRTPMLPPHLRSLSGRLMQSIPRSSSPCPSVEIEGVPNRGCQRFLLIRKKEPDLAPQCRNRDRDDVVDADGGILLEPVTHPDWNFGRQAANCSGDRCDGHSGQVRPHELPSQDENRPSLIQSGDVNWPQSISSPKVET